ncbi:MAG: hypothetical protein WAK82_03740 [Streptosporangiaceae bacterium]
MPGPEPRLAMSACTKRAAGTRHVPAVRLGDSGTVVIVLPVPNWTIGVGWPGYRRPGPAGLLD